MVDFIKRGERSEFIGSNLRELESYLRAEKATLAKLLDQSARPARLPSADDVAALAFDLDKRLAQDIEAGRAQLIRWLRTGNLRVSQDETGSMIAKGALNLRAVLADAENSKPAEQLAGFKFGRYTEEVAGARPDHSSIRYCGAFCYHVASRQEPGNEPPLRRRLLRFLVDDFFEHLSSRMISWALTPASKGDECRPRRPCDDPGRAASSVGFTGPGGLPAGFSADITIPGGRIGGPAGWSRSRADEPGGRRPDLRRGRDLRNQPPRTKWSTLPKGYLLSSPKLLRAGWMHA